MQTNIDNARNMAEHLDFFSISMEDFPTEDFETSCQISKKIKGLKDEERLVIYGLYKQATVGNVNCSRPFSIDFTGAAKWVFLHFNFHTSIY